MVLCGAPYEVTQWVLSLFCWSRYLLHRGSSHCLGSTMQHRLDAKNGKSSVRSLGRIDPRAPGSCGGGVKVTIT